jgi:phytanoyl-CoA hydroxylase
MDPYQSNRKRVFAPYVGPGAHGIEIGPGYRPTFPKAEGYSITVVDCCATEALIAKHDADANISKELVRQIEPVDVVWSGDSLQHLPVSLRGADHVTACHVIEHARDLCGFLKDCSVLLREGGYLLLAMPDRRCVLDCYRPASTLGDVLLAHLHPQAYDLKSHMDEAWYGALLSNAGAWPMAHLRHEVRNGRVPVAQHSVGIGGWLWAHYMATATNHESGRPYRDAHRWVFDPASFAQIVQFLAVNAGTNLILEAMPGEFECEFYAVLRKTVSAHMSAGGTLETHRAAVLKAGMASIAGEISTPLAPTVSQVAVVAGADPTGASAVAPGAVADVHSLLALDGEAFVRCAYATVLKRSPESAGLSHYVAELAAGVPKIEIISRLRRSQEGRNLRQVLPGYRVARLKSRLLRPQPSPVVPISTAPFHSKFGGTWIDRADFMQELERRARSSRLRPLAVTHLRTFAQRGVVVLERAAAEAELIGFESAISTAFREGHERLISQNPGDSTPHPVTAGMNRRGVRIVDSYGALPQALDLLSTPLLVEFLQTVFEQRPKLFQSLSFDTGSEQGFHQDTAYVVVDRPLEMVGCWIALEDVQAGSGELQYLIGSHRLPDFEFGGTRKNWNPTIDGPEPHARWSRWLREECHRRGYAIESFLAKRGDILIWHADLAHGGAPITHPELSRKSLVGHFCPENVRPAYARQSPERAATLRHRGISYCSWHYDLSSPSAES